jgi:Na+/H+ antiporter NhaC
VLCRGPTSNVDLCCKDIQGVLVYEFVWPNGRSYELPISYRAMPGILSLLPPVCAMVLVVVLREATLGLFFGVWVGSFLLALFNPLQGFLDTIATHFVRAWCDLSNAEVVVFALLLGGWTALIRRSGGFQVQSV